MNTMNTNHITIANPPAAGTFLPAPHTQSSPSAAIVAVVSPVTPTGWKARPAKWLLLLAGACATMVLVKAALLFAQIFQIVNAVYDSALV